MPSNKNMLRNIIIITGFLLLILPVRAQVPDDIITCLKNGNAKTLSGHFNQNVELVVPENDNVYSKTQAQLIVNEFFNTHIPQTFSVIHQGGKEGAQYVIGSLGTHKGSFRVYFLLKKRSEEHTSELQSRPQ